MANEEIPKSATEAAGYIAGVGLGLTGAVWPGSLVMAVPGIVTAALFVCWAVLLAARTMAAAIYATGLGASYEMGLSHVGWLLPLAAWLCFAAGLALLFCSMRSKKPRDHVV